MKLTTLLAAAVMLTAASAGAEDVICRGEITSIQGEGLIARSHRFEVYDFSGADVQEIIEKCRKFAAEKEAKMLRKDPGLKFRKNAEVRLDCRKGAERFEVRRSIPVQP